MRVYAVASEEYPVWDITENPAPDQWEGQMTRYYDLPDDLVRRYQTAHNAYLAVWVELDSAIRAIQRG